MNITTFSDYTLRVLLYLAVTDGRPSADKIAKAYGISFHHVAKAAQWLSREGYVISERGRNGGMSLARTPDQINIGIVMEATEGSTALVDCMRVDGGTCRVTPACGLKMALTEAKAAFYATLRQFTLEDVTKQKAILRSELEIV